MPSALLVAIALLFCAPLEAQQPIIVERGVPAPPQQANASGPPQRGGPPWLGLVAHARAQGQGLTITRVLRGSPAQRAGLKEDDILMTLGGKPLSSSRDFKIALRESRAGDTIAATFIRQGRTQQASLLLDAVPSQEQLASAQLMGEQAPGMQLVLIKDGKTQPTNLSSLRGKPVVIEFWATWCAACQKLSPLLNTLQDRHGDKLHILAISGEDTALLMREAQATGKRYTIAHDPGETGHEDFFVRSYPLIYILDSEHKVRKILTGYTAPGALEAAVEAVLAR